MIATTKWMLENYDSLPPVVYAGIDPGASGAAAFILGEGKALVCDLPTYKKQVSRKGKKGYNTQPDLIAMDQALHNLENIRCWSDVRVKFAIESATMHGGRGSLAFASFRTASLYAIWPAMLTVYQFKYTVVSPHVWKRKMGLRGEDKELSRRIARKLYPNAELNLKRHHDRAEALLLAHWLKTCHYKNP